MQHLDYATEEELAEIAALLERKREAAAALARIANRLRQRAHIARKKGQNDCAPDQNAKAHLKPSLAAI